MAHTATATEPTDDTILDGPTILARARAIGPLLRDEAAEGERRRTLTPGAVAALRDAGAFRMAMPRAWGGPELDPWAQVEVIEALARADGSAGWCAMIGCGGGYYTAALDDAAGRALYRDLDAVTAGWVMPAGRLRPVDGGYRLSGRWQFASGAAHADLMIAGAVVEPEDPGAPGGPPAVRIAVLPADRFEIVDTWDTTGLRGSGSHDYATQDAFVPAEHTFWWSERRRTGPLYDWPGVFLVNMLGVPLGIARAALDAGEEILAGKVLVPEMRPARDDARVRVAVARAEALVGSARAYAADRVGDLWATLQRGAPPSRRQRAAIGGLYLHTVRTCRDAIEGLVDVVGTAALFRTSPLERPRRDLATLGQHIVAHPRTLEIVGGLWLAGADVSHPLVDAGLF